MCFISCQILTSLYFEANLQKVFEYKENRKIFAFLEKYVLKRQATEVLKNLISF